MTKILELFESLTNIKAFKYEVIKEGITNINYLIHTTEDIFVMRIPRDNMVGINYINQGKILNIVKDLNIEVIYYDENTGIMISKYLNNVKKEKVSFDVVIKHLKKLHSINCSDIDDFDPFKLINTYKNIVKETLFKDEEKIILIAKEIYAKYPKVLCHNDVLFANFVITEDRNYMIDYEYSGMNIALFDIASFLSENNIDDINLQTLFINKYYGNVNKDLINDINYMFSFLDILWGYWAKAMHIKYKEEIFEIIFNEKLNRYNFKTYN